MTLSPSRTLVVPATPLLVPASLAWPLAYASDDLDYSLDVTASLAEVGDTLETVAVSAAPSGTGELAVQSVTVAGSIITAMLAGGQPGRRHVVRVVATTLSGRTFEWRPVLQIRATPGDPIAQVVPPSALFGPPATWALATPLSLTLARPLSAALVAAL